MRTRPTLACQHTRAPMDEPRCTDVLSVDIKHDLRPKLSKLRQLFVGRELGSKEELVEVKERLQRVCDEVCVAVLYAYDARLRCLPCESAAQLPGGVVGRGARRGVAAVRESLQSGEKDQEIQALHSKLEKLEATYQRQKKLLDEQVSHVSSDRTRRPLSVLAAGLPSGRVEVCSAMALHGRTGASDRDGA